MPALPQGRLLPTPNRLPPGQGVPPPGAFQSQPLAPPPGTTVVPQNAPLPGVAVAPPAASPAPGQRQPKGIPQTPPTLQPGDEVVTEPPAQKIINKKASFSGLDKITGRIINFDEDIGETVQFGALRVKTDACYTRPATEAANTDAFVEVDEITLQGEVKRIFSGWMFAASPGLHARRTSDLRYLADRLQGAANHRRHRPARHAETAAAAAAAGPEATRNRPPAPRPPAQVQPPPPPPPPPPQQPGGLFGIFRQ